MPSLFTVYPTIREKMWKFWDTDVVLAKDTPMLKSKSVYES